jgi:hypothetical protein
MFPSVAIDMSIIEIFDSWTCRVARVVSKLTENYVYLLFQATVRRR